MTQDSLINKPFDEYQLEKLLGQGGMARVYRAIDTRLNRYTAIKIIDAPFRNDSEYARRFSLEAQAIAQLDHPNIVTIYRYGEVDGLLYMAMQYIEGANLEQLIRNIPEGEYFPIDETLKILRQVCSALDYAHQKGVIHRDVKPSNLMIDNDERVFLTDFGLALLTEVGTLGEIFGSPHYISPEQAISSAGAVPQSDFYSVGVMLYEMLVRRLPFDDDNPMDLAMLHMTAAPPPPRQFRPDLPASIEAIILKLLAKEPSERYKNGNALVAAFEQAITSTSTKLAVTRPNQTLANRVVLEMEHHPLPPIPAAVTPPSRPTQTITTATIPITKSIPQPQNPQKLLVPFIIGGGSVFFALIIIMLIAFFMLQSRNETEEAANAPTTETIAAPTVTATVIAEIAPTLTDVPTLEAVITEEAIVAPTVTTVIIEIAPTLTDVPTLEVVITEAPTATLVSYALLVNREKDTLLITNITQDTDFPLASFTLSSEKGSIDGLVFGVESLSPQACLILAKDAGKVEKIKSDCTVAGSPFLMGENEIFWKEEVSIVYRGQTIQTCSEKVCIVAINTTR